MCDLIGNWVVGPPKSPKNLTSFNRVGNGKTIFYSFMFRKKEDGFNSVKPKLYQLYFFFIIKIIVFH